MKKSIITSILVAIIGFTVSFFVAGLMFPGFENFTIKVLDTDTSASVTEPSDDIFNFRAINPTVEVYVGQCKTYNANGECIEKPTSSSRDNSSTTDSGQSSDNTTGDDANGSTN